METKDLYSGMAVGGPMDGKVVEGRYPGAILFVSKATNKAWLYDYFADEQKFYLRPLGHDEEWDDFSTENKLQIIRDTVLSGVDATRELDREKRLQAAESSFTEVRALPDEAGN